MHWRDTCDIRVTGRGMYRFVNALRRSPAICMEQHCTGEVFHGRILRRDESAVRALALTYKMELTVTPRRSIVGKFKRFRLRFGIPVGILLGICMIFYQSNVVETIEIQGAVKTDPQTILAILNEEGVARGTWIGGIDMLHCEYRIRTSLPNVAWTGIRHTGNRLVVEIAEERDKVETVHERTPSNIIAKYDAQITGIQVHAGQLCRILGDGVAKGELLVSGVRTNEEGRTTFHHSLAKITGIYTREAELTCYLTQTAMHPTGNTCTRRFLRIFGLKLPLSPHKANFGASRCRTAEMPLQFLGWTLPCAVITETSEEVSEQTLTLTEEEARRSLNADILRFEKNLLRDVNILSREIHYQSYASCLTAHITYQVEGDIGEQSEIFLLK